MQDWTKRSLETRLKKSLAHDWIPEKDAHRYPLREYYVELQWTRTIRKGMKRETVTLTSLPDLIKKMQEERRYDGTVIIEGESCCQR